VIVTVALHDTYPREIARVANVPLLSVQRIVDDLEREGVLATRLAGNQRRVVVNSDWIASRELRALALRLAETTPDILDALSSERRRPRRRGKPIERSV
jgi:DNA-binding MarR family transcriptional regulator